jgi:acetyl-CoA/propionyl-CoA carboxylase carboxyl transferase subunit
MASKQLGADINYAWPTSEIAVMGPRQAVNVLYRKELGEIDGEEATEERRQELIDEFRDKFANPYVAADRGYIDDVIEPKKTRKKLIEDFELVKSKREELPEKKHGNIPL